MVVYALKMVSDRLTDEIFNHVDLVGCQGVKDQGDSCSSARRLLLVMPRADRRHTSRSTRGRSGKGVERGIHMVEVEVVVVVVIVVVMRVLVRV